MGADRRRAILAAIEAAEHVTTPTEDLAALVAVILKVRRDTRRNYHDVEVAIAKLHDHPYTELIAEKLMDELAFGRFHHVLNDLKEVIRKNEENHVHQAQVIQQSLFEVSLEMQNLSDETEDEIHEEGEL